MSILAHFNEGKSVHLQITDDQNYLKFGKRVYDFQELHDYSLKGSQKCGYCILNKICAENSLLSAKMPCHTDTRGDAKNGFFVICGDCKVCVKFEE